MSATQAGLSLPSTSIFVPYDRFELSQAVNGFHVLLRDASAVVGEYPNVIKTPPAPRVVPGPAEETIQEMGATVGRSRPSTRTPRRAPHARKAAATALARMGESKEPLPGPPEMTVATSGGGRA